jgi:hypothetical protein
MPLVGCREKQLFLKEAPVLAAEKEILAAAMNIRTSI